MIYWIPFLIYWATVLGFGAQEIGKILGTRRVAEERRVEWAQRRKLRIVRIGTVEPDEDGVRLLEFHFEEDGSVPLIQWAINPDGDAETLLGGYTNAELVEISRRRAEFET